MIEIAYNKKYKILMPFYIAVLFLWLRQEWQALDWVLFTNQFDNLTNCKVALKKPIKGVESLSKINKWIMGYIERLKQS